MLLTKRFQRKSCFRNRPIRNKNCLLWKLGRMHLWKVPYKDWSFCPDPFTSMAATGNSCFWLADFNKSSPLKPRGQMNRNLVGSIYGRSSITIANFVSNLYRGPSKDVSYQALIRLAWRSQRRRFLRNQPIRNKNGLWRPCLLTDRN
jgi:hypothetical protein